MKIINEKNFNIPNALSGLRLGLSPLIAYLIVTGQHDLSLAAFTIAGISDMVSLH
jgi:phosphatidylglycerophosphate synthase